MAFRFSVFAVERIVKQNLRDNADVFMDAVEAKDGEVEHKHEYVATQLRGRRRPS